MIGKTQTLRASELAIQVDAGHYEPAERLNHLVDVGTRFYDLLSPCYAHVQIPHLQEIGPVGRPDLGFPGFGWATWLGPEYEELIKIPDAGGVSITRLPDGGRLIQLALPERIDTLDIRCLQGYHEIANHVQDDILTPRSQWGSVIRGAEDPKERGEIWRHQEAE